jgi:hypothetical protein
MNIWTNVNNRLNGTSKNKWDNTQPDTILVNETGFSDGFTNYEGFQEGAANKDNCVEDDCVLAAYKMIQDCKKADPAVVNEISNLINNGKPLLSSKMQKAINPEPVTEPDMSLTKWVTRSFPNLSGQPGPAPKVAPGPKVVLPPDTKVVLPPAPKVVLPPDTKAVTTSTSAPVPTQNLKSAPTSITGPSSSILGFTNKEGFENENNGLYNFIKVAIQDRHNRFKDTATFAADCRNNSFYSMKKFIGEEKVMLDKLHNYYTSFVSSYETLYLNK